MRKTYLVMATIALLAAACKKETKEIITSQHPGSVSKSLCYGDNWTASGNYNPSVPFLHLVYNNKLYVPRYPNTVVVQKDIYIYDGTSWQSMPSNIPFNTNHSQAFAFTIGNKGYIGKSTGTNGLFYEYDFATNIWTQKASLPWGNRSGVATFSIGNKGYVMGGQFNQNGTTYNSSETWEYNPATDSWTQKAHFGFFGWNYATGFSIGNKGYLVNGQISLPSATIYSNYLFEYDPATDSWTTKASFPGEPRIVTNAFVISGYGYAGGGRAIIDGSWVIYSDFYKYNPMTNAWIRIADNPIQGQFWYNSFSINSLGYVVYWDESVNTAKLEKYTPKYCPPSPTIP
jgi:N-acetylneuraminic acid mutarotase